MRSHRAVDAIGAVCRVQWLLLRHDELRSGMLLPVTARNVAIRYGVLGLLGMRYVPASSATEISFPVAASEAGKLVISPTGRDFFIPCQLQGF